MSNQPVNPGKGAQGVAKKSSFRRKFNLKKKRKRKKSKRGY